MACQLLRGAGTISDPTPQAMIIRDSEDVISLIQIDTTAYRAATVVSAFGYKAYNPLEEAARKYCDNVKVVGCAVKAGNALVAVREGYEAALAL